MPTPKLPTTKKAQLAAPTEAAAEAPTKKTRAPRAVDPLVQEAKDQLAAAKAQVKDNAVKAKIAKLEAQATKHNDALDKIEEQIAKLRG